MYLFFMLLRFGCEFRTLMFNFFLVCGGFVDCMRRVGIGL